MSLRDVGQVGKLRADWQSPRAPIANRHAAYQAAPQTIEQPTVLGRPAYVSMNVTLLISRSVVTPARIFATADSRRNVIPSSRAARLISEVDRL